MEHGRHVVVRLVVDLVLVRVELVGAVLVLVLVIVIVVEVVGVVREALDVLPRRFGERQLRGLVVGEPDVPRRPVGREQCGIAGEQLDLEDGGCGVGHAGEADGPVPARVSGQAVLEAQ